MSVTNYQAPPAYYPAYNPNWFTALSNQIASDNFQYTIKVTDVITMATPLVYNEDQRIDTKIVFDASNAAKNYVRHYVPNNVYGWQLCTDAIRKMRVNIGETYGATPAYASGSDQEYIVWNAALGEMMLPAYDLNDFVYKGSTTNYQYITTDRFPTREGYYTSDKVTYEDKSHFLYCLSSENLDMEMVTIFTYDSSGNVLGEYNISNPYAPGTTYTDKYVCIDVGHKGLTNLASGDYDVISGSSPILTSSVAYYDVYDRYTTGFVPPLQPYGTRQKISRIFTGCEPMFDVYTIHFLDRYGNFETMNFSKVSEEKNQSEKKYYRQNKYEMNSNNWEFSNFTASEKVINSSTTKRFRLNSEWMTDEQIDNYEYIVSSPLAYLDMGSTTGLIPIKILTNEYLKNQHWNNPLWSFAIDIEYTHKDGSQNG